MKREKFIVIVSHCILNTCSKVVYRGEETITKEEKNREKFLKEILERKMHIIQLPCPEFEMYGGKRWGHSKEQFDNVFFREKSKRLLEPVLQQIKEYMSMDQIKILGIVGVDGSPSCGIHSSFSADWGGEISSIPNLEETLRGFRYRSEMGVFMEVFNEMLEKENIHLPMFSLSDHTMEEMTYEDQA